MGIYEWFLICMAHVLTELEFYEYFSNHGHGHMRSMKLPQIEDILQYKPSMIRALIMHLLEYRQETPMYQILADLFNRPSSPITHEFIIHLAMNRFHWFFDDRFIHDKSSSRLDPLSSTELYARRDSVRRHITSSGGHTVCDLVFLETTPSRSDYKFIERIRPILDELRNDNDKLSYRIAHQLLAMQYPPCAPTAHATAPQAQLSAPVPVPLVQLSAPTAQATAQATAPATAPRVQLSAPVPVPLVQLSAPTAQVTTQATAPVSGPRAQLSAPVLAPRVELSAPTAQVTAQATAPRVQLSAPVPVAAVWLYCWC